MNLMIDHTYTYIFIPHTYKCIDRTLFCIKVCDGLSLAQLFLHKGLANAYEQKAPFILLNIILFRDSLFLMSPMCLLFRFFLSHTHTHLSFRHSFHYRDKMSSASTVMVWQPVHFVSVVHAMETLNECLSMHSHSTCSILCRLSLFTFSMYVCAMDFPFSLNVLRLQRVAFI